MQMKKLARYRYSKTTMDRTFVRTCSLLLSLLAIVSSAQPFDFPSSPSRAPGLQVDEDGKIYTAAGSYLYRLNDNLVQEESWGLRTDAVNISLSSDGRWLVVCLTDLSCEVYNANNFSAGHVFRRENAVRSVNLALFAAEDSFYVGSIISNTGMENEMTLSQYRFTASQDDMVASATYGIDRNEFERNFYGGFVRGSYAYYIASDNNPPRIEGVRNFKVIRVCHNSNFGALYELSLVCVNAPSTDVRISGVSVVDEDFGGLAGPVVILSRNRPNSQQNQVCLYSLVDIDREMQAKYDSCSIATIISPEEIDLAWRSSQTFCHLSMLSQSADICQFGSLSPPALDDIVNKNLGGKLRINLGRNFITASVAVIVDSFSLVFVAYVNTSGSFIAGYDAANDITTMMESVGFDARLIPNGPVIQLQWQNGTELLYAVISTSVIQIPIANCSSRTDCSGCLGNSNPLCGWCVVENKCSKRTQCQNPDSRWIQATQDPTQCPTIMVTPQQFDLEDPQMLTLTLSQALPPLLANETYLCHFISGGVPFTVEAMGSGTTYTCNITGVISSEFDATVVDISLASSQLQIPFSTSPGALTIIQCGQAMSCSQCLQTDVCGWCVYNKVCSRIAVPCINGAENFLQPSMNQDFTDVCPLLDRPPGGGENYFQPVQVNRNIELVTRNLPAEISGFSYACYVNGIRLSATYNNESSLTCTVNEGQLTLPGGISMQMVTVVIRWIGQNSEGRNINHTIDILTMPTQVLLYNCLEVATGCSSCIGTSLTSEFECGWCDRPSGMTDTCSFTEDCSPPQNLAITGSQCPMPMITGFDPKFGPPEGGTTIVITGTNLGVSFSDFAEDSVQVGGVNCIPADSNGYEPGQRISCTTTNSTVSTAVEITLSNGSATSGETLFTRVSPQVTGVFPRRGPQAGGTNLTVYGTNLDIGNTINTTITLVGGMQCIVNRDSIRATSISCTTMAFTASDPPMSGAVMMMIDNAQVENSSVQYNYTLNPEFYNVIPSTTILGGGIELIFNGTNLDVVQSPMLEISDPEYVNTTNTTLCQVLNSTAIACVTPPLNRIEPGDVDGITYTIQVDNAPGPDPEANVSLRISVLPNPTNFSLVDTEYNIGSGTVIRIMGENLHSVSDDDYAVTVGGLPCRELSVQPLQMQINCEPPPEPPGGMNEATVVVSVGQFISEPLSSPLIYIGTRVTPSDPLPLEIILPVVLGVIVVFLLGALLVFSMVWWHHRRKVRVLKGELGWTNMINQIELSKLQHEKSLVPLTPQFTDDDQYHLLKVIPESLLISSSQLKLLNKPIGQGEFGVVYKAQLINWQGSELPRAVAVKTAKGLFQTSDIEGLMSEISKMKDFHHPNVMTLIGVCLDAGPGVSIVMPFMANGSLLEYLKKERDNLYLTEIDQIDEVVPVRKLLLRMCFQVAKGMEYLSSMKFVHRDLAARNCMLDYSGNVKVGDFGLAEDVYTRGYFRQGKDDAVKLPFKWMAPESLRDGLFSEKSDVWSFGITCWEVFSGGRIPYSGVDAISMLKILESGTRLEKPDNAACAPEHYSMMMSECWALSPEDRPGFEKLSSSLEKLLNISAGYLELSMVLLPSEAEENQDITKTHSCEITAGHPQGEESLSKTEPKSAEEDITIIHAL